MLLRVCVARRAFPSTMACPMSRTSRAGTSDCSASSCWKAVSAPSQRFSIPVVRSDECSPLPALNTSVATSRAFHRFSNGSTASKWMPSDLLSIEDSRLAEQAHWLDRRGVRVVIDGVGIDEATALRVLTKLALVDTWSEGSDHCLPRPARCPVGGKLGGVTLLDPTTVNRVCRKGQGFSQDRPPEHPRSALQDGRGCVSGFAALPIRKSRRRASRKAACRGPSTASCGEPGREQGFHLRRPLISTA